MCFSEVLPPAVRHHPVFRGEELSRGPATQEHPTRGRLAALGGIGSRRLSDLAQLRCQNGRWLGRLGTWWM